MARVLQRDSNLARQLMASMDIAGQVARKLVDSQNFYGPVTADEVKLLEDSLFDSMVGLREWSRKKNSVERKGQRG